MSRRRWLGYLLFGLLGVINLALCTSSDVFALPSSEDLVKKALVHGIDVCYKSAHMNESVEAKSGLKLYGGVFNINGSDGLADIPVVVPTLIGEGNTVKESKVTCSQMLEGGSPYSLAGEIEGIFSLFGFGTFSANGGVPNLVTLGYEHDTSGGDASAGVYNFVIDFDAQLVEGSSKARDVVHQQIGIRANSDGSVSATLSENGTELGSLPFCSANAPLQSIGFCINTDGLILDKGKYAGGLTLRPSMGSGRWSTALDVSIMWFSDEDEPQLFVSGGNACYTAHKKPTEGTWNDWITSCRYDGTDGKNSDYYNYGNFRMGDPTFVADETLIADRSMYKLKNGYNGAAAQFRINLGLSGTYYDTSFTNEDRLALYYYGYVRPIIQNSPDTHVTSNCVDDLSGRAADEYYVPDEGKWCKLDGVENVVLKPGENISRTSNEFAVISDNGQYMYMTITANKLAAFKAVLEKLMALDGDDALKAAITETPSITEPTPGELQPEEPTPGPSATSVIGVCFANANSLGWILCPVLEGASKAVNGLYKTVIVNFLEVKADILATSGTNTGVYEGWGIFRNAANTLFAIAFILIILAQVTGIGISNYNIKKLLPRLIVVVVLVNLSFLLCQLAADVSNILGSSLYDMFAGFANKVDLNQKVTGYTLDNIMSELLATLFTGGIAAGAIIVAVNTWEFWLIPLALTALGCLIGILFFFILLGVRQAGVIILIVLSPIAIVCYALPNTKSIFDKWKKMFISMLMLYPICGAMMGGSQFASALLLSVSSTDGFFYVLVVMLLSVVPFFLIPTIVRSSLSAVGNLGAKISGFGQRFSGGLQRGIRNMDGVKEQQRQWDMHNAEKTVDRFDRIEREGGFIRRRLGLGGRRLRPKEMHRRSAAIARYNRARSEDIRAGGTQYLLRPGTPVHDAAMAKQRTSDLADQTAGWEAIYRNNPEMQSVSDMETEYARLLAEGDAHPGDIAIESQIRGLQNIMMTSGDAGKDAIYRGLANHLGRLQQAGHSYDYDVHTGRGARTGASMAAAHLSAAHGVTFKNENKEAFNLLNDLKERNYARLHEDGGFVEDAPGSGNFMSTYYRRRGASGWKPETFAGSTAGTQKNLLHSIRSGAISGKLLSDLAGMANATLGDERLNGVMDDSTRANFREIVAAGMASGAQVWDSGAASYSSTDGSRMAADMDATALGDMAKYVDGLDMSDAANQMQAQQMAENVYRALMNPDVNYAPEKRQAMQEVLRAANRKGVQRMVSGMGPGALFSEIDQTTLKLVHEKPLAPPPAPEGYDEHGTWTGALGAETDDHKLAREEWVREKARRQMYNKENFKGGGAP